MDHCGKCCTITVTAILFTKRTVSLRVGLNKDTMSLFDRPEERDWALGKRGYYSDTSVLSCGNTANVSAETDDIEEEWLEQVKNSRKAKRKMKKVPKNKKNKNNSVRISSDNQNLVSSGSESSHTEHSVSENPSNGLKGSSDANMRNLTEIFPHVQVSGSGRSSHCTVNTARGVESKETNYDILQLCDIEMSRNHDLSDFKDVARGKARYYGDGFCCVYFEKPLDVRTLFSGFY